MITSSHRFSTVLVALNLNLVRIACSSSKPLQKGGDAATDLDLGSASLAASARLALNRAPRSSKP
jgi:hypothetical protein